MLRHSIAAASAVVLFAGCNADALNVPNPNAPPANTVVDRPLVQSLVSGMLIQNRGNLPGLISDAGILGRESYNYTPTDGRNTSNYLQVAQLSNNGFASGGWTGRFINMRNAIAFGGTIDRATFLSDAEKNAARGFAKTMRALEVLYLLSTRDSLGMPIDIDTVANTPQRFVSRDSAYRFASALLNDAATNLAAGGAAFPFELTPGFASFNTPANFLKLNRGIAARTLVYRGTLDCGATCFTLALTALSTSFLNSAAGADLNDGAYHVFSSSAGDALNPLSNPVSPDQVAHPSIVPDAQFNGTVVDRRLTAKTTTIPTKSPPGVGIPTTVGWTLYPSNTSRLPIMRNEELVLLRAEANIGLNNFPAALNDINFIRTTSGGLPAIASLATRADAITALLYEKRYSLLFEGHRWIDVRRWDRLLTLPLDVPTRHFRVKVQPVPQAECLFRAPLAADLRGPGCP